MQNNDITKLLKLEVLNFETYEEKEEYIILNFQEKMNDQIVQDVEVLNSI